MDESCGFEQTRTSTFLEITQHLSNAQYIRKTPLPGSCYYIHTYTPKVYKSQVAKFVRLHSGFVGTQYGPHVTYLAPRSFRLLLEKIIPSSVLLRGLMGFEAADLGLPICSICNCKDVLYLGHLDA
jgi:hypothetical protein